MKVLCVIPARFASTRLPGKPLREIGGVPMICRVYERAREARLVDRTIVATDDERILSAVKNYGGEAVITDKNHPTGTDRLAEVAAKFDGYGLIINVQGDEPLIDPGLIDELAAAFRDDNLQMATVAVPIAADERENPNNVKVVMDREGFALYFSRSLIPYPRRENMVEVYKHVGIYAYRREFLLKFAKWSPTPLEQTESLEQLRALENGCRIKVIKTDHKFIGVDTEEDLRLVNEIYGEA